MPLKKIVRSIRKTIAILCQVASTKVSPKATNQTSAIEMTSYFNGTPNNVDRGRRVVEIAVVHQKW